MRLFKTAFITGASSGLGLELFKLLQKQRIQLIATGRGDLPDAHIAIKADLIREREKVIALIEEHVPDLVINCAGVGAYGPAIHHSLDLLTVNAIAPIEITIAAAKAMLNAKKEGIILNVASAAALIPMPYMALYGAAKSALTSFSKSFDAEMRENGIRILVSLPGPIQTEFAARASLGKFRQKGGMKTEWVAKKIIEQIEKKKSFEVLDWKVRLGIFFAQLFPNWSEKLILQNLSKRL